MCVLHQVPGIFFFKNSGSSLAARAIFQMFQASINRQRDMNAANATTAQWRNQKKYQAQMHGTATSKNRTEPLDCLSAVLYFIARQMPDREMQN